MHSGRSAAVRSSNVAFSSLTEDVMVGPPTELTHRVAGGTQLQHYDFSSVYFGDVVLSANEDEPGALTRMASEAVRSIDGEGHAKAKPMVMQISSSGVCLVERLADKRRASSSDPVFVPRANLCGAWFSSQPPYFLALLQRSNPWSVPPSSPLHQKVVEQQQRRSASSTPMSAAASGVDGVRPASSSSSVSDVSAGVSGSGGTAGSNGAGSSGGGGRGSGRHDLLIVNAHVLQVDSRHAGPVAVHSQHTRGLSSKSTPLLNGGHDVHTGRGTLLVSSERKSPLSTEHLQQAQNVVALLASLFGGTEEKLVNAAEETRSSQSVGDTDSPHPDSTSANSLRHSENDSNAADISTSERSEDPSNDNNHLRLVDSQGTLNLSGLGTLTSRPSRSAADSSSSSATVVAERENDNRLTASSAVLRPAVRFDWSAPSHQVTSNRSSPSSSNNTDAVSPSSQSLSVVPERHKLGLANDDHVQVSSLPCFLLLCSVCFVYVFF